MHICRLGFYMYIAMLQDPTTSLRVGVGSYTTTDTDQVITCSKFLNAIEHMYTRHCLTGCSMTRSSISEHGARPR